MSEDISLFVQFCRLAKEASTPQDIKEILARLPPDTSDKLADHIYQFCLEQGIDPKSPELEEYYQKTSEYKKDDALVKASTVSVDLNQQLISYKENLDRGVSPSDQEMRNLLLQMENNFISLKTPKYGMPFTTWEQYFDESLNYKSWMDYSPELFNGLPFPDGSLSLIAARPGNAKSACLVNLARHLLILIEKEFSAYSDDEIQSAQKRNSKRRIIFFTLEMSPKELLTRLVLSIAWAIRGCELNHGSGLESLERPIAQYYKILPLIKYPKDNLSVMEESQRHLFNDLALGKYVIPALESGRFTIYDPKKLVSLNEMMDTIKKTASPGDIVLIDYIQKLPTPDTPEANRYAASGTHTRLKYVSDMLCDTAKETGAVFIAAAQLNRDAEQGEELLLRESGDLEQDAYNVIGLFREKEELFYKIAKARGSEHRGQSFILDWQPKFQYMANTGNRKDYKSKSKIKLQSVADSKAGKLMTVKDFQ
jgi:hypothetical protein